MADETRLQPYAGASGNGAAQNGQDRDAVRSTSEEMLSFLVHELRNPLAVIKGFAETIEAAAETVDRETLVSSARAMKRSAGHLEELVESLGDVRSLFGDEIRLSLQEASIGDLVNSTVESLAVVTGDQQIEVRIEDDANLAIDPVRIRQVLTNLIYNSFKFGDPGRPIELSVEREGDSMTICVTDHGPGIPAGREEEVFGKFTRLDNDVQGTGLGLYISRAIARAHGGELSVAPTADGCRFVLDLPLQAGSRVIRLDGA